MSFTKEMGNGVTIVGYEKTSFTKYGLGLSMAGSKEGRG